MTSKALALGWWQCSLLWGTSKFFCRLAHWPNKTTALTPLVASLACLSYPSPSAVALNFNISPEAQGTVAPADALFYQFAQPGVVTVDNPEEVGGVDTLPMGFRFTSEEMAQAFDAIVIASQALAQQ